MSKDNIIDFKKEITESRLRNLKLKMEIAIMDHERIALWEDDVKIITASRKELVKQILRLQLEMK